MTFEPTALSDVCPRLREEADISLLIDLYRNSHFTICSHGNWGVSLLHTRMQMSSRHLTKEFRVSKVSVVCGLCIRDLHLHLMTVAVMAFSFTKLLQMLMRSIVRYTGLNRDMDWVERDKDLMVLFK